jgi:hypothetical protein
MEIVQVSNEISMLKYQPEMLKTVRMLDDCIVKGVGVESTLWCHPRAG